MLQGLQGRGIGSIWTTPADDILAYCEKTYPSSTVPIPTIFGNIFSAEVEHPQYAQCLKNGGAAGIVPPPAPVIGTPASYDPATGNCGGVPCGNAVLSLPNMIGTGQTPQDAVYTGAVNITSSISSWLPYVLLGAVALFVVLKK